MVTEKAAMIPAKIHYCWFGKASKGDLIRRCIDSWRKKMSDFQVKEWNEANSPLDNLYCQQAYARGSWSKLSNYVRMHALYTEGGIYLDTDVEIIRTFASLLHNNCFVGFQLEQEHSDWVNSAVIGAEAGHQFIERCMKLTVKLFEKEGKFYRGPTITTMALREIGLREHGLQQVDGVTIYPTEYFYPYPWYGKFSPECIKENTYCIHYWQGSWVEKKRYKLYTPLRTTKKIMQMVRRRIKKR